MPSIVERGRLISGWTAWLRGRASTSQVVRRQPGAFCDTCKHTRTDFLAVVKCENHIGPARAGESLVRTGLALERPADSV